MIHKQDNEIEALKFVYSTMGKKPTNEEFLESMNTNQQLMKVGVFDSGIGGLTVVKSLLDNKLFKEIIYFGDTARVPYGIKDKNTIIRYAIEAVEFLKTLNLTSLQLHVTL